MIAAWLEYFIPSTRRVRMRYRNLLILLILFCLPAGAEEEYPKQRLDIDPALCGVWMAHASSEDGGKTVKALESPEAIARVTAGRVNVLDAVFRVSQVLITKDENGEIGNLIKFENSEMLLYVSDRDKKTGFHIIQIFETVDGKSVETMRWAMTVE